MSVSNAPATNPEDSINLLTEDMVCLTQAAKEFPAINGRRVNRATIWRWARHGVGGVQLDHLKIGSQLVTTKQAITRFIRETQSA